MGSAYLQLADLPAFGVTATQAQINAASTLIDAYTQRPEGLVWSPDGFGAPCFMAALSPTLKFSATGAIATGLGVVVPITAGMAFPDLIGDVLVLDRATSGKTEAVVVTAITPTSVTLQSVAFTHSAGALLEAGLVITEERSLPANRSVTRVAKPPAARLLAMSGRYGYGRRSQQQAGMFAQASILASVQAFGGPPLWYPIDITQLTISPVTGELWVPAGGLVANFSDVRVRYVAGYSALGLPFAVKQACATITAAIAAAPELSGNIRSFQAGGTKIEKFADSMLDAESRATLAHLCPRAFA